MNRCFGCYPQSGEVRIPSRTGVLEHGTRVEGRAAVDSERTGYPRRTGSARKALLFFGRRRENIVLTHEEIVRETHTRTG